jgi:hypothetical protein
LGGEPLSAQGQSKHQHAFVRWLQCKLVLSALWVPFSTIKPFWAVYNGITEQRQPCTNAPVQQLQLAIDDTKSKCAPSRMQAPNPEPR